MFALVIQCTCDWVVGILLLSIQCCSLDELVWLVCYLLSIIYVDFVASNQSDHLLMILIHDTQYFINTVKQVLLLVDLKTFFVDSINSAFFDQ